MDVCVCGWVGGRTEQGFVIVALVGMKVACTGGAAAAACAIGYGHVG